MFLSNFLSSQSRNISWWKEHYFHDLALQYIRCSRCSSGWYVSIGILFQLLTSVIFSLKSWHLALQACCRWPWQPTPPTTATQRLAANPMRKPSEFRDCPEISAVPSATARAAAQVMCQKVTAPLLSVLSEPPRVTSTALWFASLTLTVVSELHEDVLVDLVVLRWLSIWKFYNLVAEDLLGAMDDGDIMILVIVNHIEQSLRYHRVFQGERGHEWRSGRLGKNQQSKT